MTLLVIKISPTSRHFISPRCKCSPPHPVFNHPHLHSSIRDRNHVSDPDKFTGQILVLCSKFNVFTHHSATRHLKQIPKTIILHASSDQALICRFIQYRVKPLDSRLRIRTETWRSANMQFDSCRYINHRFLWLQVKTLDMNNPATRRWRRSLA